MLPSKQPRSACDAVNLPRDITGTHLTPKTRKRLPIQQADLRAEGCSLAQNQPRLQGHVPQATCNGVQIGPGATALTRMPRSANCAASPLVRFANAALVAAYCSKLVVGSKP